MSGMQAGEKEGSLQHSCQKLTEKSTQASVPGLSPSPLSLCHHSRGICRSNKPVVEPSMPPWERERIGVFMQTDGQFC